MTNNPFDFVRKEHKNLLKLCKVTAGDLSDLLDSARTVGGFLAACVSRSPGLDPWLHLFDVRNEFILRAPAAPLGDDAPTVATYLSACEHVAGSLLEPLPDAVVRNAVRDAVAAYATHFSVKLIHSAAKGTPIFASSSPTTLPHLSSRRLFQAGIDLPFDQTRNDTSGRFQAVQKLLNPGSGALRMGSRLDGLVLQGLQDGMELARKKEGGLIDPRVKQLLIPAGDGYLNLSPLGSGSMSVLLGEAVDRAHQRWSEKEQMHAQAASPAQQDEPALSAKATGKAKQPEGAPAPKPAKAYIARLDIAFGGSNPQNVTVQKRYIQRVPYFEAPRSARVTASVYRFVFKSWQPIINRRLALAVLEATASIDRAKDGEGVYSKSASLGATRIQRIGGNGALADLVRACHQQAARLAQTLSCTPWTRAGAALPINADLLRQMRASAPAALDLCLAEQRFDDTYRTSMARLIAERLRAMELACGSKPLEEPAAMRRVIGAAKQVLKELT